jgi:hypothetical protein
MDNKINNSELDQELIRGIINPTEEVHYNNRFTIGVIWALAITMILAGSLIWGLSGILK